MLEICIFDPVFGMAFYLRPWVEMRCQQVFIGSCRWNVCYRGLCERSFDMQFII